ncbi:folylpolyglutamate synthase [Cytobacillus firmus]|uniref:bifunctional folylpolyglutamate synthase/dihydrofolate synthase n=1 Tax=Cytobacillus firmus TaxID=1399 RepID=UPI00077CBBC3|nr:folylpolyglutamate synthase/dihydrofolate synthase family protein [Cytobacillus firmus]MBG9543572.1 folylpolyglutamate synthase [Cytobacillus firmus]MBG9554808.1 folylpolyglutamate synthase [Cytobacillus firmus]MBG9555774.1 folylpolyglutamate synthase [Cytobacillus firmus]MBG9574708.1 folylpolyglutamate synthase [Cytobacillus firmus]MEC1891356.1 bifunctional folylpolyglutamate synthase/dihydrofolate synthase [Cytobacillus firmus]
MFSAYEDALEWIHSRLRLGMKPGLQRMEWMMGKLGHPERRIKSVHIGGTNGKGSTVTFLRSILQEAGYSVGTFTSPYFENFNERISLNGTPIGDEDLVQLANDIYPLAVELEQTELGGPTEFEIITAMAFQYFGHVRPVDLVLFEVGLGGRYDSTNIIYPVLSIITSIGLDHTAILGDTYEKIAFEKAGIIKPGISVITAVKQEEALAVIQDKALGLKSPVYQLGNEFTISDHKSLVQGEFFSLQTVFQDFRDLETGMSGKHQTENASLAVMAAELLNKFYSFFIEEKHIRAGLKTAFWPGRFEIVSHDPLVVIDGAHNEEGIDALTAELEKRFGDRSKKIVFAALADKKLDKMISKLDSAADSITFTEFNFPRAASAEDLYNLSKNSRKQFLTDWKEVLETELCESGKNSVLVITGSLYFLSEVKPALLNLLENNQ